MTAEFYAYALLDSRKPGTFKYGYWTFPFEPFYVGKGTGDRWRSHIKVSATDKTFRANKIRSIRKAGHEFKVRIVKRVSTEAEAFELERRLIAKIGRHPEGPLTNLTDGGDGTAGRVRSKKELEKFSKSMKSWYASLDADALAQKTAKTKMSMAKRTAEERAETANKIRAARAGWSKRKKRQVKRVLREREANYSPEVAERVRQQRAEYKTTRGPAIAKALVSRTEAERAAHAAKIAASIKAWHAKKSETTKARTAMNQSAAAKARYAKDKR